ncbi:MAG: hypothetical protein JWM59_4438 [Verrucomicrobiales bacterium]|nr:hypothetical protein [Verrucomicrobiales bacterium]
MRSCLKVATAALLAILFSASEGLSQDPVPAVKAPPALEEAQTRARLLHSSLGGTLEVMHRDFFRKNGSRAIPSSSLEDVFRKMEQEWGITLRWLASKATIMNADHTARDEFQKAALLKITKGEKEVMGVENGTLRFADPLSCGTNASKAMSGTGRAWRTGSRLWKSKWPFKVSRLRKDPESKTPDPV